jgi:hypothetical protein
MLFVLTISYCTTTFSSIACKLEMLSLKKPQLKMAPCVTAQPAQTCTKIGLQHFLNIWFFVECPGCRLFSNVFLFSSTVVFSPTLTAFRATDLPAHCQTSSFYRPMRRSSQYVVDLHKQASTLCTNDLRLLSTMPESAASESSNGTKRRRNSSTQELSEERPSLRVTRSRANTSEPENRSSADRLRYHASWLKTLAEKADVDLEYAKDMHRRAEQRIIMARESLESDIAREKVAKKAYDEAKAEAEARNRRYETAKRCVESCEDSEE